MCHLSVNVDNAIQCLVNSTTRNFKLPAIVEAYKQYLIGIYNVRQLPADDKYNQPLDCVKHFVNLECADIKKYLQRKEIESSWEDIMKGRLYRVQREQITISQIACKAGNSLPSLVLIRGAPGVGKTTLSWELCRRWSRGELWTDYSLVLLLRLRDENVQAASSVNDLFQLSDACLPLSVESDILSTHIQGAGILFVLEGLDELPRNVRENRNSTFIKLITGRLLPASTVLVTTRPWAITELPNICGSRLDQLIEILGFTQEQIKEYISNLIKEGEAPAELQAYFDANSYVSSAMYNPLHARIVADVFTNCHGDENKVLPTTRTELYTSYCQVLVERHLTDHPVEEEWNGDLWNLPQSLQPWFNHLCEIAYQGITKEKQRLVFFKEDIPNVRVTLGFMNSVYPLYQSPVKKLCPSYNFIHLTLQEFLAAVYIWRNQTPREQFLLFENNRRDKVYDWILMFLAGLTKFEDPWISCVLPVPRLVYSSIKASDILTKPSFNLWLHESRNVKLINLYEAVTLNVSFSRFGQKPLGLQHYIALGYLLATGKFLVEFDIYGFQKMLYRDFKDFAAVKDIVLGLRMHNQCSSQLSCLSLASNALSNDFVSSLLQCIQPSVCPQSTVRIIYTRDVPENTYFSDIFLKFIRTVEVIEFVYQAFWPNQKDYGGFLSMMFRLLGSESHLTKLIFTCTKDLRRINQNLFDFVVSSQSLNMLELRLPGSCTNLEWITVGLNVLRFKERKSKSLVPNKFFSISYSDETPSILESINLSLLTFGADLKYFIWHWVELTDVIQMTSLFQTIFNCLSLENLTIHRFSEDCNTMPGRDSRNFRAITPHSHQHWDISTLSLEGLSRHASLQEIHLPYFPGFACSIFRALQCNISVKYLVICIDYEADGIADEFGALLGSNKTLDSIEIKECHDRVGKDAFVAMMEHVSNATHLRRFGAEYHHYLFDFSMCLALCKILQNNSLQCLCIPLFLPQNISFVKPFAEALGRNSSLQILIFERYEYYSFSFLDPAPKNLYRTEISSEEMNSLGEMLMANKSLRIIHLPTKFSDCSTIIKGLAANSTIEEFRVDQSMRESAIKLADYALVGKKIVYLDRFNPVRFNIWQRSDQINPRTVRL